MAPRSKRHRPSGTAGTAKPELRSLDMQDLEEILARAEGALSAEDCQKLRDTVGTLAWLQQSLTQKTLTIARLRALFGIKTSEKTKDLFGNDTGGGDTGRGDEDEGGEPAGDPGSSAPGGKKKPTGHGRNGASDYVGAEQVEVKHPSLVSGARCPSCPPGKRGKVYRMKTPRRLVRVRGQAPLAATVYELEALRCNLCGEVFVADPPPGVGDQTYDATSAGMIGLLKYGSGFPFNRLERLEGNLGIPLPAATQWDIVKESAEKLKPIHEELIRQAAQGRLLHNDDTSMRVLALRREIAKEQEAGKKTRTGIFSTGVVSELPDGARIALYFTGRKHAGENLADVLQHRAKELGSPIHMCDGLDRNFPGTFRTIVANCLAHGRRKFVEVAESFPEPCRFMLETLGQVYRHDAIAREQGMSPEDRLRYHQEHSHPLMDKLSTWMREQIDGKHVEPNSGLGKAIAYMQNRWDALTRFLRIAGVPLDNNLCERALKKAVLHRKNAYFYKTENGARVGDLFMALIHTAELAGVNAFEYLTSLLTHADDVKQRPEAWLPWNFSAALPARGPATDAVVS